MKNFRSLLAIAAIAASVPASISPAQAVTWEDLWGAVKQGLQSQAPQQQQSNLNNSEAPQQQQSQQQQPQQQQPQQQQPQQQEQSSSERRPRPRVRRMLQSSCVKVSGYDPQSIDRDSQESTISVGRRALTNVNTKISIYENNPYEMTCAIQVRPSSGKVRLAYGIADNSSIDSMRVSIYVGGQEKISQVLYRGQARGFSVDVTRAGSYAVVLKPIGASGDVHVLPLPQAAYY